jgi:hypothetical protein
MKRIWEIDELIEQCTVSKSGLELLGKGRLATALKVNDYRS